MCTMHEKPSIDPIDRNNLLQLLQHHLHDLKPDGAYKKGCIRALGIVKSILKDKAQTPTLDYAPVRHGCEYCSGERVEYQRTINTKLYMNTNGMARTLETECDHCPPYVQCSLKGIPIRSAFPINYCPNCGAPMNGDDLGRDAP